MAAPSWEYPLISPVLTNGVPDELSRLRADFDALCDQSADIKRSISSEIGPSGSETTISDSRGGRVSDDRGGGTVSSGLTTTATYPCRVMSYATLNPQQMSAPNQTIVQATQMIISFPVGSDVRTGDIAVVEGISYHIIESDAGRANALQVTARVRKLD